ncbi:MULTISPECIES: OmpA family protein [Acinetobacter]|nr:MULTISPECIES: OmpA family protein [Acinetobacter]
MSINPVELLKEKVTPAIINQQQLAIDADKKSSLLAQFYPILLSILHKFPERIQSTVNLESNGLNTLFGNQAPIIRQVVEGFSTHHSLPEKTVTSLFDQAIPLSVKTLKDEVGQDKIGAYLTSHLKDIATSFPAWSAGLVSALGLSSSLGTQASSQHVYSKEPEKKSGMFGKLLPIIGLIILALIVIFLWKSCQHKMDMPIPRNNEASEPTAQEMAQAHHEEEQDTEQSQITLVSGVGNQVQACHATVGNESLSEAMQKRLAQIFGSNVKCDITVDPSYTTALQGVSKFQQVMDQIKAVPNASIDWQGNHITVNAPDAKSMNELVEKIKAVEPTLVVSATTPLNEEQSVDSSIDKSRSALSMLNGNSTPQDVANALNIQIINFPTASKVLPQKNKEILDEAAKLIQNVPNVKLTVAGYTDSTGNAEANKTLSQRRAQSVLDYLVSKGVNKDQLTAVGYGAENPIADNVTAEGKFRNRRIEFKVVNTENGKATVVDGEHEVKNITQ